MTKSSDLLAALDAAGETLEQFGEYITLSYNPRWSEYRVSVCSSISDYDFIGGVGPTPRAAYADACANRSEKERRHAIEQTVRERIEAETEAEYARQYQADDAQQAKAA